MKNISKQLILFIFIIMIIFLLATLVIVSNSVIEIFSYNKAIELESKNPKKEPGIFLYGKEFSKNTYELDLSDVTVDDQIAYDLENFPKLEKVIIKNQLLPLNLQMALEKIYPNIKFEWNVKILEQEVANNVDSLDFEKAKIKDLETFKSSLTLLHNLKYLDLCDCNLSNEELAKLRDEFPKVKVVWRVYLGKWSLKTDTVSFSVLITTFNYRRMISKDIEVIKYCTDLQALDLGHQSITDISVIGDYLPNLRLLILADNKIKDITPLKKLKHLHYLELFMNNIKDITPLVSCKELVDLNLAHIPQLYDFSPLLDNDFPLLERLCMQNSGGTSKYYTKIKNKYSKVTIVHTGYGSTHSGWRTHPRYYAMINMFHKRTYISDLFTKYDNM